jgi:hypothetical protein
MADIDPFGQPPLVEWENCITITELIATCRSFGSILIHEQMCDQEARDLETAIYTVEGMIQWIKEGKQGGRYGGSYEEAD